MLDLERKVTVAISFRLVSYQPQSGVYVLKVKEEKYS